jgi:Ca-activated chloride channel family protein
VSETFLNRGPTVGEADYVFPLPAGAAFEALQLSINGEMVSGETLAADRARQVYEEIVRRMRDPALVEWMGAGMLRTRIFPIQPGEEKRVVVRFQGLARREGNAIRVDYVRGTAPRATLVPMVDVVMVRREVEARDARESSSSFTLTYSTSDEYGNAYSPTHTLRDRTRDGRHVVTAEGEARELTILLPLRNPTATSLSVLANRPDAEESGFALIAISPPTAPTRTTPRDVTFVVDVSGSMRGEKLQQAKAAGRRILSSLGRGDRFRLVDFSTDVRDFREGWTPATEENLTAARRYLDELRAEGSTNISGALDEALVADPSTGRLPLVVFVTDGEPTVGERSPDAIAARVSRLRGDARLFSFGVSADVNTTLIEQLALEGRGTAQFVRAGESVEHAVSLLATRLTSPVITDIRVHADGVTLRQLQPQLPVDLYAGQDLILLARYDGNGDATIRLDGRSADGPVHWTTRARFPASERANPFVGRLWAAQRLGWLAAEKRRNGATTELDAEIKSLGERFGIPTEFSSYLVVEPGMQVATMGGAMGDVRRKASRDVMPSSAPAPLASGAGRNDANEPAERRFEQAKTSAMQRAATNTAMLDSLSTSEGERGITQRVGTRIFTLRDSVWTDARYLPSMRTIRVKAFSPLYFDLVRRLTGLADALVVGDRAIIAGRSVAIAIAADGAEQMGERDVTELTRLW